MARIHWEKAAFGRTGLAASGCRTRAWTESVCGKPATTQLLKCNGQLVIRVINSVSNRVSLPGLWINFLLTTCQRDRAAP